MSEFCENCPLRGSVQGKVIGALTCELGHSRLFTPTTRFNAGVLLDENMGTSVPLIMPSTEEMRERQIDLLDDCAAPETYEKGRFFKTTEKICPALGRFAVTNPDIYRLVERIAAREII